MPAGGFTVTSANSKDGNEQHLYENDYYSNFHLLYTAKPFVFEEVCILNETGETLSGIIIS